MGNNYTIPLVFAKDFNTQIDEDLALAVLFWSIECEREKSGGFFRKKNDENVTQVSLLYRPLLVTKYGNAIAVFDGCGVKSTQIKYGLAPSLTQLPHFLISDDWASKPELYADGLNRHQQEFKTANAENSLEVRGWITDPDMLAQLTNLLRVSVTSESRSNALPLLIDIEKASSSLAQLDKVKAIIRNEITPLNNIKQKLDEKTSEVLVPLKSCCSLIEDRYNREIDKIRPAVLEKKSKYENKRLEQHHRIEARFSGRLHDLRNKRDAATAKIDAYDPYTDREPRGGIDRQHSIKKSAEHRIRELEVERDNQIATVDEKYNGLIEEEQARIDSLEKKKQIALEEPKRKIREVENSTCRLVKTIDDLIGNHTSVIGAGLNSSFIRPMNIDTDEFIVYLPIIMSKFDGEAGSRTIFLTASPLKDGKGILGGLKDLVGLKFKPLEQPNEALFSFATSFSVNSNVAGPSHLSRCHNLLSDPKFKTLVSSGIVKMQIRGWLKTKDSVELKKAVQEHFIPSSSLSPAIERENEALSQPIDPPRAPLSLVKFVNYKGVERQVEINQLETERRQDQEEFDHMFPSISHAKRSSTRLTEFLRSLRIPHSKQHCIEKNENWVQEQLYIMLENSEFRNRVRRESSFKEGEISSRIDFDVGGVGIEVKIFRSRQDFARLDMEVRHYSKKHNEIIVPYLNAGGLSNDQLEAEFRDLKEHYKQVIAYFPLNCNDSQY
jgi:hypothetical protein